MPNKCEMHNTISLVAHKQKEISINIINKITHFLKRAVLGATTTESGNLFQKQSHWQNDSVTLSLPVWYIDTHWLHP